MRGFVISAAYAYWATHDLLVRALVDDAPAVARALEDLRLAEARLERRRELATAPSALDRAALRHVIRRAELGDPVTPSALAEHLGLTRPAMSVALRRLEANGLVRRDRHPVDGRSRTVVPASRNHHLEGDDALTDRMRSIAARLTSEQKRLVAAFLDELRQLIDDTPPHAGDRAPLPG